jgi:hypothetical protein
VALACAGGEHGRHDDPHESVLVFETQFDPHA